MTTADKEKKDKGAGFLLGLASKLGLRPEGFWATQAGLAALILLGGAVAAGVGLLATTGPSGALSDSERRLTAFLPRSSGSEEGVEGARLGARASGPSSSLDYVVKAKGGPAGDPEEGGGTAAGAGKAAAAARAAAAPAPAAKRGGPARMAPSRTTGGPPETVLASAGPRLEAQAGLSGGIGADFQPLARPGASGASASPWPNALLASAPAERRPVMPVVRGAARQLASTEAAVKGNLQSSRISSPGSGVTYDGGGAPLAGLGASGGTSGMEVGDSALGGEGANPGLESFLKKVPPVPPVGPSRNATPYEGLVYAAIGATAFGAAMLLLAGLLKKRADLALPANPAHAAALLRWARYCAAAAAIAAMAAVALGIVLVTRYGQTVQGLLFAMVGGVLAYQAASVLLDSSASEKAQSQIQAGARRFAGQIPR